MPTTYRSVHNVLQNGDVMTTKGTIKNRGSKFPHMKNLLNAISRKNSGWRATRTPGQQAAEVLAENPTWWSKTAAVLHGQPKLHIPAPTDKRVAINRIIAQGDVITQSGTIKTRGSKFPHMKQLLAALIKKTSSWRYDRTPKQQIYDILAENPELLK
jgi:hypothetical protein